MISNFEINLLNAWTQDFPPLEAIFLGSQLVTFNENVKIILINYFSVSQCAGALLEREIIAQSINTGFDVANIQFDLQVRKSFLNFLSPAKCVLTNFTSCS